MTKEEIAMKVYNIVGDNLSIDYSPINRPYIVGMSTVIDKMTEFISDLLEEKEDA